MGVSASTTAVVAPRPYILITVPHAKCFDQAPISQHRCDFASLPAANALVAALPKQGIHIQQMVGDITRHEPVSKTPYKSVETGELFCDLNRYVCRYSTKFRKAVSEIYGSNRASPDQFWVMDVHSFPHAYDSENVSDCVLLFPPNNPQADIENRNLAQYIRSNGFSVLTYRGAGNDITDEATENGYHHVFLLEVNEDLSDTRRTALMTVIAQWINPQLISFKPAQK